MYSLMNFYTGRLFCSNHPNQDIPFGHLEYFLCPLSSHTSFPLNSRRNHCLQSCTKMAPIRMLSMFSSCTDGLECLIWQWLGSGDAGRGGDWELRVYVRSEIHKWDFQERVGLGRRKKPAKVFRAWKNMVCSENLRGDRSGEVGSGAKWENLSKGETCSYPSEEQKSSSVHSVSKYLTEWFS